MFGVSSCGLPFLFLFSRFRCFQIVVHDLTLFRFFVIFVV